MNCVDLQYVHDRWNCVYYSAIIKPEPFYNNFVSGWFNSDHSSLIWNANSNARRINFPSIQS